MGLVVRSKPDVRTVSVSGLEGCTLTVREPTFVERINQWTESARDDNAVDFGKLAMYRLCVVVGWQGFDDEAGKPIPFSTLWLIRAIEQNEPVRIVAGKVVREAFEGLAEQDAKNSEAPLGSGSPAASDVETPVAAA